MEQGINYSDNKHPTTGSRKYPRKLRDKGCINGNDPRRTDWSWALHRSTSNQYAQFNYRPSIDSSSLWTEIGLQATKPSESWEWAKKSAHICRTRKSRSGTIRGYKQNIYVGWDVQNPTKQFSMSETAAKAKSSRLYLLGHLTATVRDEEDEEKRRDRESSNNIKQKKNNCFSSQPYSTPHLKMRRSKKVEKNEYKPKTRSYPHQCTVFLCGQTYANQIKAPQNQLRTM